MEYGIIAALIILDIVFTIAVIVWNMSKKSDKEEKVEIGEEKETITIKIYKKK